MVYNKKQMQPLIDKFGINPETNKLFISVCEMFDGKSNYQLWAVRMIFSQVLNFGELTRISDWINANGNLISKLGKKNIVSYTNRGAICVLFNEMEGLERISLIKNIISHFNTEQKKMLAESILKKDYTPIEAYSDSNIKKWYDIFKAFNKKPMNIKNKFYSTCSAFKNSSSLMQAIQDCLNESYDWKEGKDDLLAFMEHNTKDCEVVFNEGPCVIVRVPSFDSSHKLCGNGRTGWCISREESFFKNYVTSRSNRSQYFLFDFSRKESDEFAHIGFTVENGQGIVEAQTGLNYPMISPRKQGNESLSIFDVLNKYGINMNLFMRLPSNLGFSWNMYDMMMLFKKKPHEFAVAYDKDGRVIVNLLSSQAFNEFVGKTYIKYRSFPQVDESNKMYVYMDFNLPINDDKSMIAIQYRKDQYGCLSHMKSQNIYGSDMNSEKYLKTVGITNDDFLNREAINPSILLHKYIDENNEEAAIKLINDERDNIDVNCEFNKKVPVSSAIFHRMYRLFDTIVKHKNFNSKIEDGYGEPLLSSLIYLVGSEDVTTSVEDKNILENMIRSLLSSPSSDFNMQDLNHDTPISTACAYLSEVWVVKELVSNKTVDVNVVNDFDCSALTNCIRNKNLEALKVLGQRPDLVVRQIDKNLAKSNAINLNDYIKPNKDIFGKYTTYCGSYANEDVLEYTMAMAN